MKIRSKIFVASSLISVLTLTVALICVSTMYVDGGKMILSCEDLDDVTSIKVITAYCSPEPDSIAVELDEIQMREFAYIMQNSKLKRIFEGYDGGGHRAVITLRDGSQKELFIGGSGYIYYDNKEYQCYSAIGYFVSDLFKTE